MNPILPMKFYIPDVEARQWQDGRVYLYGSKDLSGNDEYCSYEYQIFSSRDLIYWEEGGVAFSSDKKGKYTANHISPLYAPDCAYINGKYCLFYCQSDGTEGVAFSENPMGPFQEAKNIIPASGDGIDPAVLVDDDGDIYEKKKWTLLSELFRYIARKTDLYQLCCQ